MNRAGHIAVALVAVILLVRPFDCFSGGRFDHKAMDCCKKGRCNPSNPDKCCRASVPDGNQLVTSKATDDSPPVFDVVMAEVPTITSHALLNSIPVEVHPPPGSPPDFRLNLPLLI